MLTDSPVNVLIVGTGMYVCGRGTATFGTIAPAVAQAAKQGLVADVLVATRHGSSFGPFDEKWRGICGAIAHDVSYRRFPDGGATDSAAFRRGIAELPDPGAVIIVVPDDRHYEVAMAAIEAGKHVLCVKPLAATLDEVDRLVAAAGQRGVYGAVEFHKRWDLANLKMLDVLRRGEIGDPLFFHVEYSQQRTVPTEIFADWTSSTSIFQYLGVHYVDIIQFVTRARPVRAVAIGQKLWLRERGFDVHDAIEALIEWQMPATGHRFASTFLVSWVDPTTTTAMSYQSIWALGTRGRYVSDQKQRGVEIVSDAGVRQPNPYFCDLYPETGGAHEFRGYGIDSVTTFLRDVGDIAAGKATPLDFEGRRPTFRESSVATAVLQGVKLSLERGGSWVDFGPDLRPA
jgi:predicted dehydrogenase